MIILITNDDGIDAEGLEALRKAVSRELLAEIYTVAPAGPMSQVGHRVTTDEPLKVEQRGERSWAVAGTPADCVRVAISKLLPEPPDWVFSGINHGGNLGQDIYISGTVAAAREAAYHGLQSAAFSHYMRSGLKLDWEIATRRIAGLLQQLLAKELKPGEHWNVNLPHLEADAEDPDFTNTEPESAPMEIDFDVTEQGLVYSSNYAERPRQAGSDVDVCFGGRVSVSRLEIQGFKRHSSLRLKGRDLAIQAKSSLRGWEQIAKPQGTSPWFEWQGEPPPFDPTTTGYTDGNAWWLAELSRIVYTRAKAEIFWLGEDPTRAQFLEKIGIEQLASFYSAGTHAGVFRLNRTTTGKSCIAVCFRGTKNLLQWILNLSVLGEPWDLEQPEGAKVHQGFRYIFNKLWPALREAIPNDDEPIFYTGHSLGGALATYAAAELPPQAVFSFGSPRAGNQEFADSLVEIPHHRIVYHHDIVTTIPLTTGKRTGLVYKHSGRLHHLTEDHRLIIEDNDEPSGAESWIPESPARFLREAIEESGTRPPQPLLDHSISNYTRVLRARLLENL
ncbi:MAG: 5'-nucleotidase [Verrucomicrobiales bacterium]|jgi:5'-nucleotidase